MNKRRISVALVILGGVAWAVSSVASLPTPESVGQHREQNRSAIASQVEPTPLLAARYHLRIRTPRFFHKSSDQYRPKAVSPACPAEDTGKPTGTVHAGKERLAARYHLRGRTTRFFGRAVS